MGSLATSQLGTFVRQSIFAEDPTPANKRAPLWRRSCSQTGLLLAGFTFRAPTKILGRFYKET